MQLEKMKGGYCVVKLIKLTANKSSFHPVIFKNGVNIIVGTQMNHNDKNDGNTYNGVGKSLIIHLIHFCLGTTNKIESFSDKLPSWEFKIEFESGGQRYYAKRKTDQQNKIEFCGEIITLKEMRKKMLELCFGIVEPCKNLTWTSLFSRFSRRYRSCYETFDSYIPKESDYSKILNNCYLLGINTDLIISKKELREKQKSVRDTEHTIKNDSLFRQYYLGKNDAEIDVADLEYQIKQLKNETDNFRISNNYHELEKEADDKSYRKKRLENKRVIIYNYIKNIEESLNETSEIGEEKLIKIYEEAKVEIPLMIKKDINDVIAFHRNLLSNRNIRLKKELDKHKLQLKSIDEEIETLGKSMDELLLYLNSHRALDEYVALTSKLSNLQNELNRIYEYQKILKTYKDTELDIKRALIDQDKQTEDYLESEKEHINRLLTKFQNYAKRFYPQKRSGLVIKNNLGENMLRYTLDARIQDDSSDGVNEVRIICFDLLLLVCKQSNINFTIHDSRLYANMDPRQRETLFRLADEICHDDDFQYICSVNEDTIISFKHLMSTQEYKQLVEDNIILELTDDSPESKLLGVQINISLEDKGKLSDEI